jgi:photosystem II stability/assembly factor-like uncharacterized protein
MHVLLALALIAVPPQEVIARLFAATPEGPFISYSWGEHWSRIRGELRGFEGEIDVFACLGPWVFAGGSKGLFLSEDYGENYRRVESWPRGGPAIRSFLTARLFGLEPTIFVGTSAGLYRSTDSGSKWRQVGEDEIRSAVRDMGWPGPELFVATDSGLYRTRDEGERFGGWASGSLRRSSFPRGFPVFSSIPRSSSGPRVLASSEQRRGRNSKPWESRCSGRKRCGRSCGGVVF